MTRWGYLAVLCGAACGYAALGAVVRVLPGLAPDPATLGLLVGAPALAGVVTRPLGGRIADRAGPAAVMAAGATIMAAGVAPALASDTTGALFASRLAVGAGEGALMSAAVLWLLRLAGPRRRGRALGHIGLANYLGLTAGPLLAAAVGFARAPVLVVAMLLPVGAVLPALGARRPPSAAASPPGPPNGVARPVLGPGLALMLVNVGYVAVLAFGADAAGTGIVVPVFAAAVVAVRAVGASVPDRLGAAATVRVSTVLAGVGLLSVAGAHAAAMALAGTVLLGVGQGLAVPALGLLALARVPPERHGAAAGLFFAFFDAGVGVGGPVVGGLPRLTSPEGALVGAACAVVLAGLVGWRRANADQRADGTPIATTADASSSPRR